MKTSSRLVAVAVVALAVVAAALAVLSSPSPSPSTERASDHLDVVAAPPSATQPGPVTRRMAPCVALPPLSVRPYRVMKDASRRDLPRGSWVDIASYRVQPHRPTTHVMQINLDVRHAPGPRPTSVTVGWWVTRPSGQEARVGLRTFAVPARQGDRPFQITHRFTTAGTTGRAVAQARIEGTGWVTTRLTVVKAAVWWARASTTPPSENPAECGVDELTLGATHGGNAAAVRRSW